MRTVCPARRDGDVVSGAALHGVGRRGRQPEAGHGGGEADDEAEQGGHPGALTGGLHRGVFIAELVAVAISGAGRGRVWSGYRGGATL
jgi:hypothetical protein